MNIYRTSGTCSREIIYDVDANGSLGLGDVAAILEKIGGNEQ